MGRPSLGSPRYTDQSLLQQQQKPKQEGDLTMLISRINIFLILLQYKIMGQLSEKLNAIKVEGYKNIKSQLVSNGVYTTSKC